MAALLPPIPPWDGIHPIIVHFPVALLLTAPILALIGLVRPRTRATWAWATLVVLVLGTAGAFLAVMSGDAAADIVVAKPPVSEVLHDHEELAELTRNLFAALTGLFLLFLIVRAVMGGRFWRHGLTVGLGAVVVLSAGFSLALVNTAHLGGRLVHEYGLHGIITERAPGSGATSGSAAPPIERDHDD